MVLMFMFDYDLISSNMSLSNTKYECEKQENTNKEEAQWYNDIANFLSEGETKEEKLKNSSKVIRHLELKISAFL